MLLGFLITFGLLISELAKIDQAANRGRGIRRYLDEVQPGVLGLLQGNMDLDSPMIVAGLIDELNVASADLLVDARAILDSWLRGSDGAANGSALLLLLLRVRHGGRAKDQYKPLISQRLIRPKSAHLRAFKAGMG